MPRQADFISSTWQLVGRQDPCPKANSLPTISGHELLWGVSGVYRQREGATCRNSRVSPDSHLEIGLTSIILIVLSTGNLQFES